MAEQTFRSPGFFENEIDLSTRSAGQLGTPAGVIGTSDFGPAFVPVTIGNFRDFETRFGGLNPKQFGPYAVREFLKYRSAVTYTRVLGAGANTTTGDIANTSLGGIVKNAGFVVKKNSGGTKAGTGQVPGSVVFLTAKHTVPANSDIGFPVFTDNDTFSSMREKNTLATAIDAIDFNSANNLNSLTITVPTAAGGTGTAVTITFSTTNAATGRGGSADAIGIDIGGDAPLNSTHAQIRAAAIIAAINSGTAHGTLDIGGNLTSGVAGITASAGTGDGKITITATSTGTAGNSIALANANGTTVKKTSLAGGEANTEITSDTAFLIRGGIMTTTASHVFIFDTEDFGAAVGSVTTDLATHDSSRRFKIGIYSEKDSSGNQKFGQDDGVNGLRMYTASLDPNDAYYIGKVLNTEADDFAEEQHLLYWDYAVEDELASVNTAAGSIALVSGSGATVSGAGATVSGGFEELYGRFDTRYAAPSTTKFISQPFGATEFDLFHFECISDGAYANDKFKISIADLRASTDPNDDFGTFEVQVRKFDDSDLAPEILERYPGCSLNPNDERYVARVIGDFKLRFNFDEANEDERRLVLSGKYPNRSSYIRVQMSEEMQAGEVPDAALPFGFRGIGALNTSPTRANPTSDDGAYDLGTARLFCKDATTLTGSIVPPLPYRYKVTKGAVNASPAFLGEPGLKERADARFYWGVKTDRIASGALNVLNANAGSEINPLVRTYTKLQGIQKLDALTSAGSQSDDFNNHKFTLARVALRQQLTAAGHIDTNGALTGSSSQHMKEAVYIRNGAVDAKTYTVKDVVEDTDRITLASLINSSSLLFNRFTAFAKFTNIFHGGFDGLNILDKDCAIMNDKAASTEDGGKAADSFTGGMGLVGTNNAGMMGSGKLNNTVASYRAAAEIMTDPMTVRTNILAIPGIRDPYVTDFAADLNKDYSMSIYLMDIPNYDEGGSRLFYDSEGRPGVTKTSEEFTRRNIDNNYAAVYFPDVFIEDPVNGGRNVKVPSSVAAIGALAFTDSVAYPWFAPAGFNRGALDFVKNVSARLTTNDRDELYDARINPIATFPGGDFVIFGQKTLQIAKSALDRVNVRRMMLELKRQVIGVADRLLFEQNNQATRDRFINLVSPRLSLIQAQQGIESFRVVMDDTNNTELDRENNRLNGKIIVVPTRSIEFIAIDFIITNAGVSFE